jgi:hypothetical protein
MHGSMIIKILSYVKVDTEAMHKFPSGMNGIAFRLVPSSRLINPYPANVETMVSS